MCLVLKLLYSSHGRYADYSSRSDPPYTVYLIGSLANYIASHVFHFLCLVTLKILAKLAIYCGLMIFQRSLHLGFNFGAFSNVTIRF